MSDGFYLGRFVLQCFHNINRNGLWKQDPRLGYAISNNRIEDKETDKQNLQGY